MKLNIPPLSQRDDRWKLKKLGTSSTTIGNYGCLLTCHAMMLAYYGHEFLPDVLNEVYKTKEVFDLGNRINFWAAANAFDDINAKEYYNCYDLPCDLNKIDEQLKDKHPVIALVDFSPTAGVQTHFILIIGKADDGAYHVNDPWTGEEYFFHAKYGDPSRYIYGLRIYEGNPKNGETIEDQLKDCQDKVKSLDEAVAEKALECNSLRTALEEQERNNKDFVEQLDTARKERDKEAWAKEQFQAKVKTLEEEVTNVEERIEVLKEEKKALRSDLVTCENKLADDLTMWQNLKSIFRKIFGR